MSEQGKIRIELNIATALIIFAMLGITAMTAFGFDGITNPESVDKISKLSASGLLALITILSLGLSSYLIRLLFGRLLSALDANTQANADMARLLAERPCIRNPKND